MSNYKEGLDSILQAINNLITPQLVSLKYDKTFRGKITSIIDNGLYEVQVNGRSYTLPYAGTLQVGDIVKVKSPLNNFSDIYIEAIGGSSNGIPIGTIMQYAGFTAPQGYLLCEGQALSKTDYAELYAIIGNYFGGTETEFYLPDLRERVPVGRNSAKTDYALGETGGTATVTLTIEQMPSHTHIQNSHNHTQSAHNHGLNSHTHSIPAHSHGLNSHTHSFSATTSTKELKGDWTCVGYKTHTGNGIVSRNYINANSNLSKGSSFGGIGFDIDASHNHTVSGTTGAASGSTANSSALTSGAASGNTASVTATNNATTATNQETGGGNSHNNMQPYIVLNYIIKVTE